MVLRHSAAHVMAEAVCTLFPQAKLVYGPPIEDGFYYDIELDQSITPDDFERIEQEMARIIKEDRPFCHYEIPRDQAMAKLEAEGNRYKIDNAKRAEGDTLSFYITGRDQDQHFEDLCRGPHIPSTGVIGAYAIKQISRSHYRGDVNEQPLQRVHGTAFFKQKSLKAYFKQLEEAKARDHRVLGRDLELFTISPEVGSGMVLWLPNRGHCSQPARAVLARRDAGPRLSAGFLPAHRAAGTVSHQRTLSRTTKTRSSQHCMRLIAARCC